MDSRSSRAAGVLIASILLSACGSAPTQPSRQGPARLDGQISQTRLSAGDKSTVTFELRNVGGRTLTLNFTSGCQILPYVRSRRTQQIVHPSGGGWGCTLALTSLVLAPGESKTQQVHVHAADSTTYPYVALPTGDYEAYAELQAALDGNRLTLRSASLPFSVE